MGTFDYDHAPFQPPHRSPHPASKPHQPTTPPWPELSLAPLDSSKSLAFACRPKARSLAGAPAAFRSLGSLGSSFAPNLTFAPTSAVRKVSGFLRNSGVPAAFRLWDSLALSCAALGPARAAPRRDVPADERDPAGERRTAPFSCAPAPSRCAIARAGSACSSHRRGPASCGAVHAVAAAPATTAALPWPRPLVDSARAPAEHSAHCPSSRLLPRGPCPSRGHTSSCCGPRAKRPLQHRCPAAPALARRAVHPFPPWSRCSARTAHLPGACAFLPRG